MAVRFQSKNQRRRRLVLAQPEEQTSKINGIDYVEVLADGEGATIHLYCLWPADPLLDAAQLRIEGDSHARPVRITRVASPPDDAGRVADARHFVLTLDAAGDDSDYTLRIVGRSDRSDIDPRLSDVLFSFTPEASPPFDWLQAQGVGEAPPPEPEIDYQAKDYASFRRLMLDRLALVMPDWQERNPADLGVVLVELLAHASDHLSYYQDAVATEAYLGTARQRISVRRHARLLNYFMHEGCNARALVHICVDPKAPKASEGVSLPALPELAWFLTRTTEETVLPPDRLEELRERYDPEVFTPMHDAVLWPAQNRISFYTWEADEGVLPRGSTSATLRASRPGETTAVDLHLCVGDLLIFEEIIDPTSGNPADADAGHRHAVRLTSVRSEVRDPLTQVPIVEIEWGLEDALPFPLCLALPAPPGIMQDVEVTVARGNIVLAEHGLCVVEKLPPVSAKTRYRPRLAARGITHSAPYDHDEARSRPVAHALVQDPREALPALLVTYDAGGGEFAPRRDLLRSGPDDRHVVLEVEGDGQPVLRFGDGVLGASPAPEPSLSAQVRVGNGTAGNVAADQIVHVVVPPTLAAANQILSVRNPLPASGGVAPESMEQVRLDAPQAFQIQERAVTEADYAAAAERHPDVQKAICCRRWTGSWSTMFVTVDRRSDNAVDEAFKAELRAFLEPFRLLGHDLVIDVPRFVALDIRLGVLVEPTYLRNQVKAALLEALGTAAFPDGRRGFFHPDNLTFGQSIYLSELVRVMMQVPGVASVDPAGPDATFRRRDQGSGGETVEPVIAIDRLEIARVADGDILLDMSGGI